MNLFAFDIDGTLIPEGKHSSDFIQEMSELAIIAQNSCSKIILVTGRSIDEVLSEKYLIEILNPLIIITNCGMEIFTRTNSGHRIKDLDYSKYQEKHDIEELDVCVKYTKTLLPNIKSQVGKRQFEYKKSYFINDLDLKKLKKNKEKLRKLFPNTDFIVSFTNSLLHNLDIHYTNLNKFGPLDFIMKEYSSHEVYYFGDNGNDIPCINNLKNSFLFNTFKEKILFFYGPCYSKFFINDKPGPTSIVNILRNKLKLKDENK